MTMIRPKQRQPECLAHAFHVTAAQAQHQATCKLLFGMSDFWKNHFFVPKFIFLVLFVGHVVLRVHQHQQLVF